MFADRTNCAVSLIRLCSTAAVVWTAVTSSSAADLEAIRHSPDGRSFVFQGSGETFTPWGFNYDHDGDGRLLEDYWEDEWQTVVEDFGEMKALGANVVRIHLQLGRFMQAPEEPNEQALDKLADLVRLAERSGLYLDLTGLGCYHKQDVPPWYDALSEEDRWDVQARFWEAVAARCAANPAVFCYDLMNEPVVPGGRREPGAWLGPAFAGKHFVQFITLDQRSRPRHEIARAWISHLVAAIRRHDPDTLITVGLVPWSLDRPGLTSGFVPEKIADELDFIAMHIYPERGKLDEALETVAGFDLGKPLVIEETFPLRCSQAEFDRFLETSAAHADGWIGFYWGQTPAELREMKTIPAAMMLRFLERFQQGPPRPPGDR